MNWIIFEGSISFLEMLTSCFFASRLFSKKIIYAKDMLWLVLFSLSGALLLTAREMGLLWMPDFLPSLLIFTVYACLTCHVKLWLAVLWALLNYFLIGVVTIAGSSAFSLFMDISLDQLDLQTNASVMLRVMIRVLQLLICEIILHVKGHLPYSEKNHRNGYKLILVFIFSILALSVLWKTELQNGEEVILYSNIFICILVLIFDFAVLFFYEIISKEKNEKEMMMVQNQISNMQIRSQNEINGIYYDIRALKHDMNAHLHTIFGYLQMSDYQRAEEYIQKIIGEVNILEAYQSGNNTLDALIGSKSAMAKRSGIRVQILMTVPQNLNIADEHLVTVIGNLYDNAIDACLQLKNKEDRYITIQIFLNANDLVLSFKNSAVGGTKENNEVWLTTKQDSAFHGFGLKNIDRIVQMYGGYCERHLERNEFICRIRIPNISVFEKK